MCTKQQKEKKNSKTSYSLLSSDEWNETNVMFQSHGSKKSIRDDDREGKQIKSMWMNTATEKKKEATLSKHKKNIIKIEAIPIAQ